MDEEDVADAEEARKVQTSESFAGLGSTAEETTRNGLVMDILKTSGETMGVKLLKKMGWRDGQGIGPKVRRRARLDEEDDPGGGGGKDQETHLFAPENSAMMAFDRKDDRKGLGFEGEGRLGDTMAQEQQANVRMAITEGEDEDIGIDTISKGTRTKKKKQTVRGGFGVGILNDNGSDEEDAYSMGPQISYNRTVGGDKKKRPLATSRTAANPLLNSKPIFISKKAASTKTASRFRRCHDGRLPIDGFVLSSDLDPLSSIVSSDKKYPPPTIPPNWKSAKTKSSSNESTKSYLSAADVAKASNLSPKSRAALLGEAALPGKSVFDYLSNDARSRIASATNNRNLPPAFDEARATSSSKPSVKSLQSLVPELDSQTALTALGRGTAGWMPYAEDASKRSRYRSFLEIRAGLRGPEPALPERASVHSTDDWVNEMKEFAHAAQIFKPMTGLMANRFTSASSAPKLASDRPDQASDPTMSVEGTESLISKPAEKKKNPAEEAASLGMFGPLTRSTQEWHPTRLLCKRFNVKPPRHADPGGGPPGFEGEVGAALPQRSLELVGKKEMDEMMRESNVGRIGMRDMVGAGGNDEGALKVEEGEEEAAKREEPVVVDPERNEALEKEKPGEDIFKAIFGSDSEDD